MLDRFSLDDIQTVVVTLAFFSPSFLIYFFRSNFITGRRGRALEIAFELAVLSAVYYAAVGTVFLAMGWLTWFAGMFFFFVIPFAIGLASGIASQKRWFDKIYETIGLNPIHPANTAWDFMFGTMKENKWVIVQTVDGRKIVGFFDRESGASSDLGHRDIFISDVRRSDFSRYEKDNRKRGMWIREDQIVSIETISD